MTVALDLAKEVFQVHGVSMTGDKVFNKKIKRAKLQAFLENLLDFVDDLLCELHRNAFCAASFPKTVCLHSLFP